MCSIAYCVVEDKSHLQKFKPHFKKCAVCEELFPFFVNVTACVKCSTRICVQGCLCQDWVEIDECLFEYKRVIQSPDVMSMMKCYNLEVHPLYKHISKKCECYNR